MSKKKFWKAVAYQFKSIEAIQFVVIYFSCSIYFYLFIHFLLLFWIWIVHIHQAINMFTFAYFPNPHIQQLFWVFFVIYCILMNLIFSKIGKNFVSSEFKKKYFHLFQMAQCEWHCELHFFELDCIALLVCLCVCVCIYIKCACSFNKESEVSNLPGVADSKSVTVGHVSDSWSRWVCNTCKHGKITITWMNWIKFMRAKIPSWGGIYANRFHWIEKYLIPKRPAGTAAVATAGRGRSAGRKPA